MRQNTSRKRRRKKEPETQKFVVTTIKKNARKKLANINKMIVVRLLIRMGNNWKHIFHRG